MSQARKRSALRERRARTRSVRGFVRYDSAVRDDVSMKAVPAGIPGTSFLSASSARSPLFWRDASRVVELSRILIPNGIRGESLVNTPFTSGVVRWLKAVNRKMPRRPIFSWSISELGTRNLDRQ